MRSVRSLFGQFKRKNKGKAKSIQIYSSSSSGRKIKISIIGENKKFLGYMPENVEQIIKITNINNE